MVTVSVAQAKARLSDLLDKVEAGEDVVITRHGHPVAQVVPMPGRKQPLRLDDLAAFRAAMTRLPTPSVDLLRAARDEGR